MTDAPKLFHPPKWMRSMLGPFASRIRLLGAIAVGVVAWLAMALIPHDLRWSTRAILAWDAGAVWFIAAVTLMMLGSTPESLRARAAAQDEGEHVILALVLVAVAASLGTIAAELSIAKNAHGSEKAVRVALVFATVALSWYVVQLVFALHYAHEFYQPEQPEKDGDGDGVVGGLGFPGDEDPDYWDFVHFAVVIGVASQTADVSFKSKALRHIGTVHGVVAFLFNTVVLALTINLAASLF